MRILTRRDFAAAVAAGCSSPLWGKENTIDSTLRDGIAARKIPCAVAMVADSNRILYQGAYGTRDSSGGKVTTNSIFSIASMTKAITATAAMQLVERGLISLDQPIERYLPQLRGVGVLTGYDASGQPVLRPPMRKITLRHLLSHTSGLCYSIWDKDQARWQSRPGAEPVASVAPVTPLMFDPGTRWQYGTGVDFVGKLVETLTGQPLEDYFQRYILAPLEMTDTSFILPAAKVDRLASGYRRNESGVLVETPRTQPEPPKAYNGSGGLFSTAGDYVKFMQMILRHGTRSSSTSAGQILSAQSVAAMSTNQTGNNRAGVLKTTNPSVSADIDLHPGASDRYTLAFLLNPEPHKAGRAAGSLGWAGILNTFYWIDPVRDRCAVLMMQFMPFGDKEAIGMLNDFERAVYSTL